MMLLANRGLRYPKNQWRYAARLFSVPVQQFLSLGQGTNPQEISSGEVKDLYTVAR